MSFVYFLLGLICGTLGYHLWAQKAPKPIEDEDTKLRLLALEEQLAYITTRIEEIEQKTARPNRAKKSASLGNKQEQILELESQGYEPQAIARELNIPLGQVELVMRLFRKGSS